jgi:hypothetical protein
MSNDIAANRISCKPQKLQAMLATVKIGRGNWRQVGQAGRKEMAAMPWSNRGTGVDRPATGRPELANG